MMIKRQAQRYLKAYFVRPVMQKGSRVFVSQVYNIYLVTRI